MTFMRDYWVFTFICFSLLLATDQIVFSGKYRHQMWLEIRSETQIVSVPAFDMLGKNVE
jgi:hypothetical protein